MTSHISSPLLTNEYDTENALSSIFLFHANSSTHRLTFKLAAERPTALPVNQNDRRPSVSRFGCCPAVILISVSINIGTITVEGILLKTVNNPVHNKKTTAKYHNGRRQKMNGYNYWETKQSFQLWLQILLGGNNNKCIGLRIWTNSCNLRNDVFTNKNCKYNTNK